MPSSFALRAIRFLLPIWRMPLHEKALRLYQKLIKLHLDRRYRGTFHIGANEGAEAYKYGNRKVIWIEANPELMPGLLKNIAPYSRQQAYCALLGDGEREVDFHIASNSGLSSSVYSFGRYSTGDRSLWPDAGLKMQRSIRLRMETLDRFVESQGIDLDGYDHWVVDVQGAELLVLQGAEKSLAFCKAIVIEISTVEVYEGGALYPEIKHFLVTRGFMPLLEPQTVDLKHGDVMFVHASVKETPYLRALRGLLARSQRPSRVATANVA